METIGLVKFDFLGLTNLTMIDEAVRFVQRQKTAPSFEIRSSQDDDPITYQLLQSGATTGVFQSGVHRDEGALGTS